MSVPKDSYIVYELLKLLTEKAVFTPAWKELAPRFPQLTREDTHGGDHDLSPFPYSVSWALHHLRQKKWISPGRVNPITITVAGRAAFAKMSKPMSGDELLDDLMKG